DGYNDTIDAFPLDPNEWEDWNGDGVGDNEKPVTLTERLSAQAGKSTFYGSTILMVLSCLIFLGLISNRRNTSEMEEIPSSMVDILREHEGVGKAVPLLLAFSLLFSIAAIFTDEWMVDDNREAFYGLSEAKGDLFGVPISFSYGDICELGSTDDADKVCTIGYGGTFIKFMMWLSVAGMVSLFVGSLNQKREFIEVKNIPENSDKIIRLSIPIMVGLSLLTWFIFNPSNVVDDLELIFGDSFWFAMAAFVFSIASLFISRIQYSNLAMQDKQFVDETTDEPMKNNPLGSPQGPPINQKEPPVNAKGVMGDDGYEWLEFPPESGEHFYRVPDQKTWMKWDN
ncbi:hypothetical protein OAV29_03135, partial [Candidatus Poseidoniaceae archaeon]|nr:hypothetical protein [Candidatus Poseidoniaceae archaeon]